MVLMMSLPNLDKVILVVPPMILDLENKLRLVITTGKSTLMYIADLAKY